MRRLAEECVVGGAGRGRGGGGQGKAGRGKGSTSAVGAASYYSKDGDEGEQVQAQSVASMGMVEQARLVADAYRGERPARRKGSSHGEGFGSSLYVDGYGEGYGSFSAAPIPRLYLLVHNIDGAQLRHTNVQTALSILAEAERIHLLCSIDHVNAPLLWSAEHKVRRLPAPVPAPLPVLWPCLCLCMCCRTARLFAPKL